MKIKIREYTERDLTEMTEIWNEVVEDGVAFPQVENLTVTDAAEFFAEQSFTAVAENLDTGKVLGLYILHPNNIGRCGHISNTSYAVKSDARGRKIGEALVSHSIEMGRELGFSLMQFNAVVKTNYSAIHIYEKLGFVKLGVIPNGFLMKDETLEDIIVFYRALKR